MLIFRSEELSIVEESTYNSIDFSLVYRQQAPIEKFESALSDEIEECHGINHGEDDYLIADSLTIVFSHRSRALVAFDAYTNREFWGTTPNFELPNHSGTGGIYLPATLPDHRLDLCVNPIYLYCARKSLLMIALGCDLHSTYYRISRSVLVGLHCGRLTSFWIEDLQLK